MKSTAFCLWMFWPVLFFGQDPAALRHTTTDTYKADFYIQLEDKKVKYVDTLFYYWFKSQKVHVTQGYASGDLLTGNYTSYFFSGQMLERGNFELGLKTGEWKTWYESGQLQSILHFENGILNGNFFRYDESGKLVEAGAYKNGQYHGEVVENGTVKEYRNGEPTVSKEPKHKKSDSEKKEKIKTDDQTDKADDDGDAEPTKKFKLRGLFKKDSEKSTNTGKDRKPFFDQSEDRKEKRKPKKSSTELVEENEKKKESGQ